MTDRETPAQSHPDDEETATNLALISTEAAETELNMHQLLEASLASNASNSLGRLEDDLKLLHSKWQAVEKELTKRDEKIALLKDEIDATKQENVSLEQVKKQLEHDLEERQGSSIEASLRLTELESQNVELRVRLQELQNYIDGRKADWQGLNEQLRDYENTIEGISGSLQEQEGIVAAKDDENTALAARVMELERELAEMKGRLTERESSQAELDAAQIQISQLETSESLLREELSAIKAQLEESGVTVAENEIRLAEMEAVLLESQSEQKRLEVELEAQRELVQVLEQEVGKNECDHDLQEEDADRVSSIGDGIRKIDFEIDDYWSESPDKLSENAEDADEVFDVEPGGVMLTPEELFPDPAELAEHLLICEDTDRGELVRYPLIRPEMTIGRSHKADIRLNSKFISREHARIIVDEDGVLIEDAGSMNGFLVNSEPSTRHRLVHGDRLEIGKRRLRYLDTSLP